MNRLITGLSATVIVALAPQYAGAYGHANRYGGSTEHEAGVGTEHTNAWGGNTEHAWGGGTEHSNVYGGHTEGEAGYGASHTNMYGDTTTAKYGEGAYHTTPYYGTAYVPPAGYAYDYHPPAEVNYYGAGCYNCGGWDAAGAAVAGAVVGATVATAAESSSTTTATTNAYNAGVATGAAEASAAASAPGGYTMGAMYPKLPAGCVEPTVQGNAYYLCGNTWFQPIYGSGGVYYKVVPTP